MEIDIIDLIQSIQNNLFRFLIVFVIAQAVVKIILAWVSKK